MQPPRRPCDERNSQQVGNLNLGHDGRFAKSNDELIGLLDDSSPIPPICYTRESLHDKFK